MYIESQHYLSQSVLISCQQKKKLKQFRVDRSAVLQWLKSVNQHIFSLLLFQERSREASPGTSRRSMPAPSRTESDVQDTCFTNKPSRTHSHSGRSPAYGNWHPQVHMNLQRMNLSAVTRCLESKKSLVYEDYM